MAQLIDENRYSQFKSPSLLLIFPQAAQAHNTNSYRIISLTAAIYYYITTKFGYTKCDLHLTVYDSVVLQQVLIFLQRK